jgi:hypothetical protein
MEDRPKKLSSLRQHFSGDVSAISITGALVLPDVMQGMAEASITRKRATPRTRHSESKTVLGFSALPD